jgi:hypothetical protein
MTANPLRESLGLTEGMSLAKPGRAVSPTLASTAGFVYHRFAAELTGYPIEVQSTNAARRHGSECDVFLAADGLVRRNGCPDGSLNHRGISTLVCCPEAMAFAHQQIQSYGPDLTSCFCSASPTAPFPDLEVLHDRDIARVGSHVMIVPKREYSLADLNTIATCSNPPAAWTPCPFGAAAEPIELPEGDLIVECACLLLEHLVADCSLAIEIRFEAALVQYYLAVLTAICDLDALLSVSRVKPLLRLGLDRHNFKQQRPLVQASIYHQIQAILTPSLLDL